MKNPYGYKCNGETIILPRAIEGIALSIAEDYSADDKRAEELVQECKILDSLVNALIAIRS